MKKKIEIEVDACDNCKRHDMELKTCIGCGITLCDFCAGDILGLTGDIPSLTIAQSNKYKCSWGYRQFYNFKYPHDIKYIYFCSKCLKNPLKHKVATLLKHCIAKEKMIEDEEARNKKYEEDLEGTLDRSYSLVYDAENRLRKKGIELIKPEED